MRKKHLVIIELCNRGIRTDYFIKQNKLSAASFYGTVSGKNVIKKVLKALKENDLLEIFYHEFPHLREKQ